jgi:hypothetical protein
MAVDAVHQAVVLGDLSAAVAPAVALAAESVLIVGLGAWIYERRRLRRGDG